MNKPFNSEKFYEDLRGFMKQEGIRIDDLSRMDLKRFGLMMGRFAERYGYTDEQIEIASPSWANQKSGEYNHEATKAQSEMVIS